MGLNKNKLKDDIVAAMKKQMPPEEPLPDGSRDFAGDLAAAIHTYVSTAAVIGVEVEVEDLTYDQVGEGD